MSLGRYVTFSIFIVWGVIWIWGFIVKQVRGLISLSSSRPSLCAIYPPLNTNELEAIPPQMHSQQRGVDGPYPSHPQCLQASAHS